MATVHAVAGAAVALLVGTAPLWRGLFFPGEQLLAVAGILVAAALWWVTSGGAALKPLGWLDLSAAAVPVTVLASTLVAVDRRAGLQQCLLALAGFAVYLVTRSLPRAWPVAAVVGGGVLTALLGVAAAGGQFGMPDAVLAGRLASTLQYPNSAAAYWTAATFLALAAWQAGGRRAWRLLAAAAAFVCFFALLATLSRGGLLVFALVAGAYVLASPQGQRFEAMLRLAVLGAAGLPSGWVFQRALAGEGGAWAWVAVAAGSACVVALAGLWDRLTQAPAAARRRAGIGAAGLVVAGAVALAVTAPRVLPTTLWQRLQAVSVTDYSVWSRLEWSRDALRMVADRPLLGWGGGGWNAAYHAYQRFGYYTRHVHNDWFEIWVEHGTVGLAAWLTVWLSAAAVVWQAWRSAKTPQDRVFLLGGSAAAAAIGLHSLLDFNLALAALQFTLWMLFGYVRAEHARLRGDVAVDARQGRGRRAPVPLGLAWRVGPAAAALAVAAFAVLLYAGFNEGQRAVKAFQEGRWQEAELAWTRAIARDPWNAAFFVDRATVIRLLVRQGLRPATDLARAVADMERAVRLEPYNANFYARYADLLVQMGDYEGAVERLQRAAELHPYAIGRWENLAAGHALAGRWALERGDVEHARHHLRAAVAIPAHVRELAARVPPQAQYFERLPTMTAPLALAVGQAYAMLGEFERAEEHLAVAAAGEPTRAEALLWLGVVKTVTGRADEGRRLIADALVAEPAFAEAVSALQDLLGRVRKP